MSSEVHLRPPEAAELLGLSAKTLANWRGDPTAPGPKFRRIGNKIFYPRTEVLKWMEGNLFSSTAEYPEPEKAQPNQGASVQEIDAIVDDLVRQLGEAQAARAKLTATEAPQTKPARKASRRARRWKG